MEGIGIDHFEDGDQYGYVATQLTHLHKMMGFDVGNILSHVPIHSISSKNSIASRKLYSNFFTEIQKPYAQCSVSTEVIQRDPLNDPSVYVINRKTLLGNKMQMNYNDDQ